MGGKELVDTAPTKTVIHMANTSPNRIKTLHQQSTIMLSRSFQGESSVLRVRLRVIKTHYEYTLAHYEYALAEWICISGSANTHHFHLVHIHNGWVCICNEFFMTLKSDSHYWSLTLRTAAEKNSPLLYQLYASLSIWLLYKIFSGRSEKEFWLAQTIPSVIIFSSLKPLKWKLIADPI